MAGRQPLIYLKDYVFDMPSREIHMAEIGEGNLSWPEIIKAAEENGVEYALVEQDACYERSPFESLEISYRYLHGVF